jgi:hypothetical protein
VITSCLNNKISCRSLCQLNNSLDVLLEIFAELIEEEWTSFERNQLCYFLFVCFNLKGALE